MLIRHGVFAIGDVHMQQRCAKTEESEYKGALRLVSVGDLHMR